MADAKTQTRQAAEQAAEAQARGAETGARVIEAAGQFQERQIQTLQQNLKRWQDVQLETMRVGADILFIQMDMATRLGSCRRPDEMVGVGEEAYKAVQDRIYACMDMYRDLTSRQYETMNRMFAEQRPPAA